MKLWLCATRPPRYAAGVRWPRRVTTTNQCCWVAVPPRSKQRSHRVPRAPQVAPGDPAPQPIGKSPLLSSAWHRSRSPAAMQTLQQQLRSAPALRPRTVAVSAASKKRSAVGFRCAGAPGRRALQLRARAPSAAAVAGAAACCVLPAKRRCSRRGDPMPWPLHCQLLCGHSQARGASRGRRTLPAQIANQLGKKSHRRYNPAQLRWERDDRKAALSLDDDKTIIKPKSGIAYQVR